MNVLSVRILSVSVLSVSVPSVGIMSASVLSVSVFVKTDVCFWSAETQRITAFSFRYHTITYIYSVTNT